MATITFISYGAGHVAMLRPVAEELQRRGHDVRFLAITTARAALSGSPVPVIGFADLWAFAEPGARAYGEELARELGQGGPVAHDESVAYLGMSFAELVRAHGEIEARRLYAERGRHAFLPVELMRRWLSAERPDLVVATNSPRAEQAALLAAGQLGIPSVCAVDLFAFQEIQWCGQPGYADRVCVLNDAVRDRFIAAGRRPEDVVVTGNPAFDRLTAPGARARGEGLRRARGWDDGRSTILWASQVEPDIHPFDPALAGDPQLPRRVEQVLRDFVADRPDWRLLVRYHPSERVAFEPAAHVEQSLAAEPLDAVLHAVDLVVVTASTVGLEAALVGKPVISVDASVFTPDTRYDEFGISTGVADPDALRAELPRLASAALARPPIHQSDTRTATERVIEVIESQILVGALD